MKWNLNDEELQGEYYKGADKDLAVQIISTEDDNDNPEKPFTTVTFKIIDGIHKGKTFNNRFYCWGKARFKMRNLALACGLGELGEDNKLHFPDDFKSKMCIGKKIKVDTEIDFYNDKERSEIKNFNPISEPEHKDFNDEIKEDVETDSDTGTPF